MIVNSPSTPASQPQQIVVVQRSSGLGMLIAMTGWLGFFGCGLILLLLIVIGVAAYPDPDSLETKVIGGNEEASDKIAVITIDGVISETQDEGFVKRQIDEVANDDSVKAIVIRVDSPGGAVTGADYLFHHLKKLKKEKGVPVVVSMGGMAASGGYYVSMAVGDQKDSIYAEPTTTTGSIGVIIPHYDISGLLARFDVKDDSISSHERKQMLAMTRPINPEHRQIIQSYVNETFDRFKSIVKEGRPKFSKDSAALDKLATGEIFSADQALKSGLVDKIGFLEDAVDRAIALASLTKDDVQVVKYKKPVNFLDEFALMQSRSSRGSLSVDDLLEMSTPRAYYLVTSLPALATSRK
ncbi:MAG: signal peptide peptidase SppA [Pirellulaceae bacterium]